MTVVRRLPSDYVDFLTNPGLDTNAGPVALQRYMGSHAGNTETRNLFAALIGSGIKDTDSQLTARGTVGVNEWAIMEKGQGNHTYFVKLWNWMWDNQEQMRDSSNKFLSDSVYNEYFKDREATGANPFRLMVRDHFFGIECIGFVSNYLRWVGQWSEYLGVDNHHWSIHFTQGRTSLDAVDRVDLLEWVDKGHIAMVDQVYSVDKGVLRLDISQCSGYTEASDHPKFNGPMKNKGVTLKDDGDGIQGGARIFTLGGDTPVPGRVQVRHMPGLIYGGFAC